MTYNQFSELQSGATVTMQELASLNAESFTIKDNSVRGAKTIYASEIKAGDMVNNGTRFIVVVH